MAKHTKVSFVIWPRRLARHRDNIRENGFEFIGWVWLQKACLTNNINHGWIAFLENQTEEKINPKVCECCKQLLLNK